MKIAAMCFAVTMAALGHADAQVIQAVNRFTNANESEKNNANAEGHAKAAGVNVVSQADAQVAGTDQSQIGLQAVDLWVNRYVRLYARLTLPVKAPATTKTDAPGGEGEAEATKVSDTIVRQMVDPYGGVFNLSGGYFRNVKPWSSPGERTTSQPEHGLFVDARTGFKFLELPDSEGSAPSVADKKMTVMYTGALGAKFIAPLYDDPAGGSDHLAGGLTLGVYIVGNVAADPSQSPTFGSLLKKHNAAITGMVGVNLPNVGAISFMFTPASSDAAIGRSFVFSFNVLRPVKEVPPLPDVVPAPAPAAAPAAPAAPAPPARRVPLFL